MSKAFTSNAALVGAGPTGPASGFAMAGLSWQETKPEHYEAWSGDFKYELYRDPIGRWTGHVERASTLLTSDRSCNSIATQADYLVNMSRRLPKAPSAAQ